VTDGVISAVVFGFIALCACVFDAAAVRLWFMKHRLGSLAIGLIACAALVVTFTTSLGAIAGRADTTQAERTATKDEAAADRAELKRITGERAAKGAFTPADADTVSAARGAVASAERTRQAECGNGDPRQRGPNCRQRETEEQAKRDALTAVLANKALAERAARLDKQTADIRARLKQAPRVQNANPLGAALEQIVGGAAAALTAWQQAIVAGVFELCLVGVMVIYELLGQDGRQRPAPARGRHTWRLPWQRSEEAAATAAAAPPAAEVLEPVERPRVALLAPRKGRSGRTRTEPDDPASVHAYVRERLEPGAGHDMNMRDVMADYVAWCRDRRVEPKGAAAFADEMKAACRRERIAIDVQDGTVVCRGVKLTAAPKSSLELATIAGA
jgi:hypothetical protein